MQQKHVFTPQINMDRYWTDLLLTGLSAISTVSVTFLMGVGEPQEGGSGVSEKGGSRKPQYAS
jgi:hypothetical protein